MEHKQENIDNSFQVQNTGIVLLNNFIVQLFEKLHLVSEKRFTNQSNQIKAVRYLDYIVTGTSTNAAVQHPLINLLCGLPINFTVLDNVVITNEVELLTEALIKTTIGLWKAIDGASVDGFRNNWLVRDGLLQDFEDKVQLQVESKAFDVLLSQSPFSFSIIRYPWMEKAIFVEWA
jgi:Contractile injection system tape measure protein